MDKTILYIGDSSPSSTSRHRADALKRLGNCVYIVDLFNLLGPRSRWHVYFDYRTGYRFLQRKLFSIFKAIPTIWSLSPDLIWIDSGELVGPYILSRLISKYSCPVILYNIDDPLGQRDFCRFALLRRSLPYYSLCVFIRQETALEALALGASKVLIVHRSYDEVEHALVYRHEYQLSSTPVVSFIGTLIPGESRDSFLLQLVNAGIPLRLTGDRWNRSPFWPILQPVYQGPSLAGCAYSQALADAAVTLGFLSHQNRDLVTTRSFETTASGGLLCAERTSEHQLFYEDRQEAMFWESTKECILTCKMLLESSPLRNKICISGLTHLRHLGVGNEDICRQILLSI